MSLSWVITNEGRGRTLEDNWFDEIIMSADDVIDDNDDRLGRLNHSGVLDAGESYTATQDVTLPVGVSGDFYFFIRTDSSDSVFESVFELNNTGFDETLTTINLTPPPDLEVESVNVPTVARAGDKLTINYRVTNFGATETPDNYWTDSFYLSVDDKFDVESDVVLGSIGHFGKLDAGASYDNSASFTLDNQLTGDYYVFVATDSSNNVFELDNNNNTAFDATPVTISSQPADLIVSEVISPTSAEAGKAIQVNWTVKNEGTGNSIATSWNDQVILSVDTEVGNDDDIKLNWFTHEGLLDAEDSYNRNGLVEIPFNLVGDYNLFVVTDVNNAVYEAAEDNNNSTAQPITITRQTPDLQVTEVTVNSATGLTVEDLTVNWTVQNLGAGQTNSNFWYDKVYLSADENWDSNDIYLGDFRRTNVLAANEQYNASKTFTVPFDAVGDFYVIVRTDTGNQVLEASLENNNDRVSADTITFTANPNPDPDKVSTNLPPQFSPDLVVNNVDAPTQGISGQSLDVSWTVSNQRYSTGTRSWYDVVYLSRDQVFDRKEDIYLGSRSQSNLAAGDSYTVTESFDVSRGLSGSYYVFVATDSGNNINEPGGELNNIAYDRNPTQIILPAPADLVAGTITIPDPANGVPGQNATIGYTVENRGSEPVFGNWYDSVYISADDKWDINDSLFAQVQVSESLENGESYSKTVNAPLPGVLPGDYHVIIRSDIRNNVPELDESNNLGASLEQFALDAELLELGTPDTGTLEQGQAVYYRIDVGAGETLLLDFNSVSDNATNELYISYGKMPTRNEFDFSFSSPFSPDQRIVIPSTKDGTYYVFAYSNNTPDGAADYTINAETIDFSILDTNYGRGGTAGQLTLEINGAKFDRSVTAKLLNEDGSTLAASSYYYVNQSKLFATFDLTKANPGAYDVLVENAQGKSATVSDGLEVVEGGGGNLQLYTDIPNSVARDRKFNFTVNWINNGINDINVPLLSLNISRDLDSIDTREIEETVLFSSTPNGSFNREEQTFLGVVDENEPPGILRPGKLETTRFFSFSDNDPGDFIISVNNLGEADRSFNWESLRGNLIPQGMSNADFEPIFNQLIAQVGNTWDDYVKMLARNSNLLPEEFGSRRSPSLLLNIELQKAIAAVETSITGVASATDLGVDLSGRSIVARNTDTRETFVTFSLKDGSFIFEKVTPGSYEFIFDGAVISEGNTAFVSQGEALTELTLTLIPGAEISGKVRSNTTGETLAFAEVSAVSKDGTIYSTFTDEDGQYTLEGIVSGTYTITAQADGKAQLNIENVFVNSDRIIQSFDLIPESIVTGTINFPVVDSDESEVQVLAQSSDQLNLTNAFTAEIKDSAFIIKGLSAGTYDITFNREGYVREVLTNVTVPEAETVDLGSVNLTQAATITGSVTSTALEDPAASALIGIFEGETPVTSVEADADGNFIIDNLAPGSYKLRVLNLFESFSNEVIVNVASGSNVADISLEILPGASIVGTVKDADTNGIFSGITVIAIDSEGNSLETLTDENGSYRFDDLHQGDYIITLPTSGANTTKSVTVTTIDGTVFTADLETPASVAQLRGKLLTANGEAIAGGNVRLIESGELIVNTQTNKNGEFEFRLLREATFDLQAIADGVSFTPITGIEINTGENIEQEIIAGNASLEVTVNGSNESVDGGTLILYQQVAQGRLAVSSKEIGTERTVTFENLALGTYEVDFLGNDNYTADASTTITDGMVASIAIEPEQQYTLTGLVTDNSDNPLAFARLLLVSQSEPKTQQFSFSDADGNYEIPLVSSGVYDLVAFADDYTATIQSGISISESTVANIELTTSNTELTGKLVDSNNQPISFGFVTLLNSAGYIVGQSSVQADGSFNITTAPAEDLIVEIQAPGYTSQAISDLTISNSSGLNIENVELEPIAFTRIAKLEDSANISVASASFGINTLPNTTINILSAPNWLETEFGNYEQRSDQLDRNDIISLPQDADENCRNIYAQVLRSLTSQNLAFDRVQRSEKVLDNFVTELEVNFLSELTTVLLAAGTLYVSIPAIATAAVSVGTGTTVFVTASSIVVTIKSLVDAINAAKEARSSKDAVKGLEASGNIITNLSNLYNTAIDVLKLAGDGKTFGGYTATWNLLSLLVSGRQILQAITITETRKTWEKVSQQRAGFEAAIKDYEQSIAKAKELNSLYNECLKSHQMDEEQNNNDDGIGGNNGGNNNGGSSSGNGGGNNNGRGNNNGGNGNGGSGGRINRPTSLDPNDILGPQGFGQEKWVSYKKALNYTIRFENDPVFATAPAQTVRITQQLDADLDFRTFRLGDFGFGDVFVDVPDNRAFYQNRLDLTEELGIFVDVIAGIDVTTGEIFWEFTSIDPTTGELPIDALTGFLPPNINLSEGEGFVSYSVRPKSTSATGDIIDAEARIVFDVNEPIDTPPIFNTLDATSPSSTVAALPAKITDEAGEFTVNWGGNDDNEGSGIASYTIYVSVNDGEFRPWLENTDLTEATYKGTPGRTYSFYAVATDNAGNTQEIPTQAQATTRIAGGTATIGNFVWVDTNGNGIQDTDEPGLEEVTVNLYDNGETLVSTTTTNINGFYSFTEIDPGDYLLEFIPPTSYLFTPENQGDNDITDSDVNPTTGKTLNFTVEGGEDYSNWDAGLYQLATISGQKFHDIDGNKLKDTNEPGLPDWTIYLDTNQNGALDNGETSTQTDADGNYSFNNLVPGTYTVAEIMQPGWQQTFPGNSSVSPESITTSASNAPIFTPSTPITTTDTALTTTASSLINLDDFRNDSRFTNIDGSGFASVVIDTGIDLNHPFFGADSDGDGIADRIVYQYDFADNDTDASDINGHGSHVASIIASSDSTYTGVAPKADIIALKVFKDSGSGYFLDLEESLQWVIDNANTYNIASINLSLGDEQNWNTSASHYGIGDELAALAGMGIIVTSAAGNNFAKFDSKQGLAYPAADPNVIAVGAVWEDTDQIADFSQRDQTMSDVFAPGIPIEAANANGGVTTKGGTSQAAPYTAGIAVLAQQIATQELGRKLTIGEFRYLLETTSVTINDGDDENDNVINTGLDFSRVDMLALAEGILNLNSTISNPDSVQPDTNSDDTPLFIPNNVSRFVHTVTVNSGETVTGINFGNQQVNQPPELTVNKGLTLNEEGTAVITNQELQVTDVDNTAIEITYTLTNLPENGILRLNGTQLAVDDTLTQDDIDNERLEYVHNGSETSNDSFSFKVTDGKDGNIDSTEFQITVNPVNDVPTLESAIANQIATEDSVFNFTIPENTFNDVDALDELTYSVTLEDGNALPDWLNFNPETRTFSGTPTNDNVGNLNIKVTATDKAGANATDTFTLEIENVNDAPTVVNQIADTTSKEDEVFNFTIPDNTFNDVDALDELTYSVTLEDGSELPSWLSFDASTRSFSGTPSNGDVGTVSIKVVATDSFGETVSDTFTLTVENTNDVPTLESAIANQIATEDSAFNFTIPDNTFNDVDAEDELTYSVTLEDGSELPSWLTFDASTR
ncbi:carboxypeptidase regulatory-like domain-containing protein, partial [Plectonema cf. radiosum LEGE 06105]